MRHLVSIKQLTKNEIESIFNKSAELKKHTKGDELSGKTLAMFFEKPSTRTRVSFETAMTQLGGHAVFLSPRDMQLSRGETMADTAKVLSRYTDAIMARTYKHDTVVELAKHSTVPVINGLTDHCHPCQILTDLFSVIEKRGTLDLKFAWIGDGNNVCNSFIYASSKLNFPLIVATPKGYEPAENVLSGSKVVVVNNPKEATKDADVIITDTWVSMGQEDEKEKRLSDFKGFQVNSDLVKLANANYLFMHCLPAHRGYEVSADVIDGVNSIVFDEAENRLHVQKGILYMLVKK